MAHYDFYNYDTSLLNVSSPGNNNFTTTVSTGSTAESSNVIINWPKVVFSIIISVIGLLGNSVVIFVILVLREYRKSVTHWYVLQLALADFLFLLTLPFKASEDINKTWIYAEWMCKAKETVLFLNYYASIMFLMIMSIDRYVAVCHNFSDRLQNLRKPLAAVITTSVSWIICLCLCVPVMLFSATVGIDPFCSCSYVFPSDEQSVYDQKNFTAICVKEGATEPAALEKCLELQKLLQPQPGSTKHCKMLSPYLTGIFTNASIKEGGYDYSHEFNISILQGSAAVSNATSSIAIDYSSYDPSYFGISNSSLGVSNTGNNQATTPSNSSNVISAQCTYQSASSGWKAFMIFNFAAMFVLPVVVMVVCYGLIIRRLSVTKVRSSNTPSSSCAAQHPGKKNKKTSTKSDKDRKRVTIMCAALVTCFVVFWLPFHVNHLAKLVGIRLSPDMSHICENLAVAGSLMAYINSALNPYLYSFLGTSFLQRWKTATGSISKNVRRRASSTSGAVGVKYNKKKHAREGSTANQTSTVMTKMYKGKPDKGSSISETKQSIDSTNMMFNTETHHAVSAAPTDDIVMVEHPAASENIATSRPL